VGAADIDGEYFHGCELRLFRGRMDGNRIPIDP